VKHTWKWQFTFLALQKIVTCITTLISILFYCELETDHVMELSNEFGYKNIINSGHKYNHKWMLLNNTHRITPNRQ
jgi:hypothetical protein